LCAFTVLSHLYQYLDAFALSVLASVFPQPIQYQSRQRSLQRFLNLPQLNVKLLWFPLIKYWIRQVQTGQALNRDQRRRLKKLKHHKYGHWIIAIDRTQWKGRNVFMVSLVWGTKEFWILDFGF